MTTDLQPTPDESALIEARRLRDAARVTLRTDIATLRQSLEQRPLTRRLRDEALHGALGTLRDARDLALENRAVLLLTGAALVGWLARKPFGASLRALAGRVEPWGVWIVDRLKQGLARSADRE